MTIRFPLAADSFTDSEIQAAIDVMRAGRYTMGPKVHEFEIEIARWLGARHAVMVNSGSSANLLLVDSLLRRTHKRAQRLRAGDEVLLPALAWPTTVWPVVQLGLRPVFADVDPETLAIDLESASRMISNKTKAMFLIHILGQACDMDRYVAFCSAHDIALIEDCCESMGSFNRGRSVGTFGYGGTFSCFFSHHLTTMEGGIIITDDPAHCDDLRSMRAHGWTRDRDDRSTWEEAHPNIDPRFLFVVPGYNVRPLEIQGAIGLVQLKRLEGFLEQREDIVGRVHAMTRKLGWLRLIGHDCLGSTTSSKTQRRHSWMNMPFLVQEDAPFTTREVMSVLEDCGIETRPILAGNLIEHPSVRHIDFRSDHLPQCTRILKRGFMTGCHPGTNEAIFDSLDTACTTLGRA